MPLNLQRFALKIKSCRTGVPLRISVILIYYFSTLSNSS